MSGLGQHSKYSDARCPGDRVCCWVAAGIHIRGVSNPGVCHDSGPVANGVSSRELHGHRTHSPGRALASSKDCPDDTEGDAGCCSYCFCCHFAGVLNSADPDLSLVGAWLTGAELESTAAPIVDQPLRSASASLSTPSIESSGELSNKRSVMSCTAGCLLLSLICCAPQLAAQDPFEIHIYEYEPLWRGQYSLEAHLNMTSPGHRSARWNATPHGTPDPSHSGAHFRRIGELRSWVHVSECLGAGLLAAICRLARPAAPICA